MRILFIADYISKIPSLEEVDLIVLLGDLDGDKLAWLKDVDILKIGVYGNHCRNDYFKKLNIQNMHLKESKIGDIRFFGLEGCVKYKGADKEYSQVEYYNMLKDFQETDVFISHCPPEGINDNPQDSSHLGVDILREKLSGIKLFVHGHSYPKQKWSVINDTWILYVHGYEYVDLNDLPIRKSLPKAKSYGEEESTINDINPLLNFLKDD